MWGSSVLVFIWAILLRPSIAADYRIAEVKEADLKRESTLLRDWVDYRNLKCLRFYSEAGLRGGFSDLCSSNELLLSQVIFQTKSVCAPKDQWWDNKRYWILYEQPGFRGNYIVLFEQECVRYLERILSTVGSVLTCTQQSWTSTYVKCEFPSRPWRHYQPLTESDLRSQIRKASQIESTSQPSIVAVSGTVDAPETKLAATTLDDLKKGAVDWRTAEGVNTQTTGSG